MDFPPISPTSREPVHVVVQLPPNDPGQLGIGTDTDTDGLGGTPDNRTDPDQVDSSFYSTDGFATPAIPLDDGELGLNLVLQTFELVKSNTPQLRRYVDNGELTGDFTYERTGACRESSLAFFGTRFSNAETSWSLWLSDRGNPIQKLGPTFTAQPDAANRVTWMRLDALWPGGFPDSTFSFVAVSGALGVPGSIAISNEITIEVKRDLRVYDDGTFESGWITFIPPGPTDYFHNYLGSVPCQIKGIAAAVANVSAVTATFPRLGLAPENLALDPSGGVPDLSRPYVDIPFSVPRETTVWSEDEMLVESFLPFTPITEHTHLFIQLEPGNSSLLVMADESTSGFSYYTFNGYTSSPPQFDDGTWGLRPVY